MRWARTYGMDEAVAMARMAPTKLPNPVEMVRDRRARRSEAG